jgi:hypothetical protein
METNQPSEDPAQRPQQASRAFGFNELFGFVLSDIAKAVSERSDETPEQQSIRFQAAAHMVMGFLPRDTTELMLAGHCALMHETMLASAQDTLRGEAETTRNATRSNLVALNKEFNCNLRMLQHYQARPAQGRRDGPQGQAAGGGPETAPPAAGPQAGPGPQTNESDSGRRELDALFVHLPDATIVYHPSAATIAECRANPEAMAALDAGDPEGFARALGVELPAEALLEAADMPAGPWPAKGRKT